MILLAVISSITFWRFSESVNHWFFAFGAGVFETDDCQKTYDELVAKGVEFTQPPTEQFYGIEAMGKDNSGNWFSLVQR